MPAIKKNKGKKLSEEPEIDKDVPIDVQYNPEVVAGILGDLKKEVESKCAQIQRDVDFMSLSLQQAFNLELIKLPAHVKQMPLSRFREEFGESLEAVTRGAMHSSTLKPTANIQNKTFGSAVKSSHNSNKVFETPSGAGKIGTRIPKEGEVIVSVNGSPLGEFKTVVKEPRANSTIIPQTPGVIVLDSGAVVDVDTVETLDPEMKQEAITKVQVMMENMQATMAKLAAKK